MEIQSFGDDCQFSHILFLTSRVTADEIRYDLLTQFLLCVDVVEYLLKLLELLERWFAHEVENLITGVLWCHL